MNGAPQLAATYIPRDLRTHCNKDCAGKTKSWADMLPEGEIEDAENSITLYYCGEVA